MTIPLQFASLYDGQEVFVWSDYLLDLGTDFLVGNNYGLCMRCVVSCGSTSFPWLVSCFLLWSSAVRVHDLQAYGKMDVTRECISRILELREILLSFQTGFNLVNAAVVCAILGSILGLEPSTQRRSTNFPSSSSPAKPSMSSAKRRFVIALPPMLTVPS